MYFHGSRCLPGVKTVRDTLLSIYASQHLPVAPVILDFWIQKSMFPLTPFSYLKMETSLIPSKSCWTWYCCAWYWHNVYVTSPSAVGNHHLPCMLWTACVFSVPLEILGWLASPVQIQTTRMSHGSENICLNTKCEIKDKLLEDCRETLKIYRSQSTSC